MYRKDIFEKRVKHSENFDEFEAIFVTLKEKVDADCIL